MENFKSSGVHSKQAHVKIPEGCFEEEHGRKGFFGRVSQLYHTTPPVAWSHIEGDLKPRSLPSLFPDQLPPNQWIPLLKNQNVILNIAFYHKDFKNFFRNADYDELFFIHDGQGLIETSYGPLEYTRGDYIVIPRGTTYKLYKKSNTKILKIESKGEFEEPSRGILGPNALYDQTVKTIPKASPGSESGSKEYILEIKRLGKLTTVNYPQNPLSAIGWKGSLYPWKISIYDFCPIHSHRYHVPPSAHTTFVTPHFVICSFVERPLEDEKHGVLKVPFYHSNIDYDEVLFYHQGNFFSRDDINEGALTLHPQGIHHGPHPKAFQKGPKQKYTDEYAVMLDSKEPLEPTPWFLENENKNYWKSWIEK